MHFKQLKLNSSLNNFILRWPNTNAKTSSQFSNNLNNSTQFPNFQNPSFNPSFNHPNTFSNNYSSNTNNDKNNSDNQANYNAYRNNNNKSNNSYANLNNNVNLNSNVNLTLNNANSTNKNTYNHAQQKTQLKLILFFKIFFKTPKGLTHGPFWRKKNNGVRSQQLGTFRQHHCPDYVYIRAVQVYLSRRKIASPPYLRLPLPPHPCPYQLFLQSTLNKKRKAAALR